MAGIYAQVYNKISSTQWTDRMSYNVLFLQCCENFMNDLLKSQGHVFLNEIYDELGIQRTIEGCKVGWVYGEGKKNHISFGIPYGDVRVDSKSILLDFNPDGEIWDIFKNFPGDKTFLKGEKNGHTVDV